MNDWLLTKDEINAVVVSVQRLKLCDDPYMSAKSAAKAQAKKLVEWFETYKVDDTAGLPTFILSLNEWQALKKEVEDG